MNDVPPICCRPPKVPPPVPVLIRPRPSALILPFMVNAMTGVAPTTSEVFAGRDDDVANATAAMRAAVRRTRLELAAEVPLPAAVEAGIAAVTWWGWSSRFLRFEDTIFPASFCIFGQIKIGKLKTAMYK